MGCDQNHLALCVAWLAVVGLSAWPARAAAAEAVAAPAAGGDQVGTDLRVSKDGHFLVKEDGAPFYFMGDTAWELFFRLNRDETIKYLDDRAAKKFTVIQAAAISCFGGTGKNAYGARPCDGNVGKIVTTPGNDPTNPGEYDFWDHVEFVVDQAAKRGMYVSLTAVWSNQMNAINPDNAEGYGKFLGSRFAAKRNIIWVVAGDAGGGLQNDRTDPIWRALARGIALGVSGKEDYSKALISFHPAGVGSSNRYHNEAWLAFNMTQTGHARGRDCPYTMIAADYARSPAKPVLDYEPTYEALRGQLDEVDARVTAYQNVFAGACGNSYGHVSLFQMFRPGQKAWDGAVITWEQALLAPGGAQMQYVRALMESRPMLSRVPDQALVSPERAGGEHISATRGDGYLFVYSGHGLPFTVKMGAISGTKVRATWYDPRTGKCTPLAEYDNTGTREFTPPSQGRGNDWVLVLDDVAKKFPDPGTPATPKKAAP